MSKDEKPKSNQHKTNNDVPKPATEGKYINLGHSTRGENKGNVPRMENKPKPPTEKK